MITLRIAPPAWHTRATPPMSPSTSSQSRDFSAPTLITMSTSVAPSRTAFCASKALDSGEVAPSGNPTTVHTSTSEPLSSSAHSLTHEGLTQTDAKPYLRAS